LTTRRKRGRSADDLERERRRATALDEAGELVPVDEACHSFLHLASRQIAIAIAIVPKVFEGRLIPLGVTA
jgi:hypothetical protein